MQPTSENMSDRPEVQPRTVNMSDRPEVQPRTVKKSGGSKVEPGLFQKLSTVEATDGAIKSFLRNPMKVSSC